MKLREVILLSVMLLVIASCARYKSTDWPRIKDVGFSCHFRNKDTHRFFTNIQDSQGNILYYLDVRFFPEVLENMLPYDYDYSGMLHCRLYPADMQGEMYPNIFMNTKNPTRDWECCSRFLESDVIGLINAPNGRKLQQRCKVRGMNILIEISNVIQGKDTHIDELDFSISFRHNPNAKNNICISLGK